MRFPIRVIWDVVGDVFKNVFRDEGRRPIDLMWQGMGDLAGQGVNYVDAYKKSRDLMEVEPFAPWGSFYIEPKLLDVTSQTEGVVLGVRGNRWISLSQKGLGVEPVGYFRLLGASIPYSPGSVSELQNPNWDETSLSSAYTTEHWNIEDNPSSVFGENTSLDGTERWTESGPITAQNTGLLLRPQGMDWCVLSDKLYFDGGSSWSQIWKMKIETWGYSNYSRSISVSSFGDVGASYELRLTDTGSEVEVAVGAFAKTKYADLVFVSSTKEITRTHGSFISDGFRVGMNISVDGTSLNDGSYEIVSITTGSIEVEEALSDESVPTASLENNLEIVTSDTSAWRDILLAASEDNPVNVEFLVEYTGSTAELFGKVFLNGEVAAQKNLYSVSPGRRTSSFDVFNQDEDVQVVLEFMGVPEGKIWERSQDLDFSTDIGDSFSFIYEVDAPLVDCSRIQISPYDLSPAAEVISHNSSQITLNVDPDYNHYVPDFARIEQDGLYLIAELESYSDYVAVYNIIRLVQANLSFVGEVSIHPWYTEQIQWVGTSIFSVPFELPFEGRSVWFLDSKAAEIDLYNRYGNILDMPEREDSQVYLDSLRGMNLGLALSHTKEDTQRSIGVLIGLPYSTKQGFIEGINRVNGGLGQALYDEVTIGGRIIKISPFWNNNDLLFSVGTFLGKLDPMVEGVKVYDWKEKTELIQELVDPWKTWGTVLIQIPSTSGLSLDSSQDLARLIKRSKGVHTNFVTEFYDQQSENQFSDMFETMEKLKHETYAHAIEDMTFDDDGEVIGNASNFQTVGGSKYSEEYQHPAVISLDSEYMLDQYNSLDSNGLAFQDVKLVVEGSSMGGEYWPDRNDPYYKFRNGASDMKRDLDVNESGAGLSKVTLRTSSPNSYHTYFHRPYSLNFMYTAASPQFSTRDGGGTAASYHTQTWEDVEPANVELYGSYMSSTNYAYVCGENGAIYETTDYGLNWTDKTISTTEEFFGAHNNWVVGSNSIAYERQAGTWTSVTVVVAAHTLVDVFFIDDDIGWVVGDDGTDAIIFKTIDGGVNWDAGVTVDTTSISSCVHFVDSLVGYVGTDNDVFRTDDGGATWTSIENGIKIYGIHGLDSDTVVCAAEVGVGAHHIARITDASTSPVTSDVLTLLEKLEDIHFMEDGLVGDAVGANDTFYRTVDGGLTWVDVSDGNTIDCSSVHGVGPWGRIVTGTDVAGTTVMRWM